MLSKVNICDVTLRDGLQNLNTFVSTEIKIKLLEHLINCGLKELEVTSFVHPKAVPQFSDAQELLRIALKKKDVTIRSLVPNLKGVNLALEAGASQILFVFSASEIHNQSNVNMTINQSLEQLQSIVESVRYRKEVEIQVALSTTFGYQQDLVTLDRVDFLTEKIIGLGIHKIVYCDTSGLAVPTQVEGLIKRIRPKYPQLNIVLHFHDTYGSAIANCVKAVECGADFFESSVGGLGGCPFAVNASGNVATEDLVWVMEKMGIHTRIDLNCLIKTTQFIQEHISLDRPISSRVYYANI